MSAAAGASGSAALDAALRSGRHEEALALARTAVAEGSADSLPLRIVAIGMRQVGQFDQAIELLGRVTGRTPDDAAPWADLAECLAAARRPERALEVWDRVLTLAPDSAAALCGKARVLHSLSRVDDAATLFNRAIALEPGHIGALLGLARLALEAGRLDEADVLIESLAAEASGRVESRWLAARIALGREDARGAASHFDALLRSPQLTPAQRAETLLALGEALAAVDETAKAFAAAVEGKAIQRRLFAERAAGREGEVAKLNRLAEWFGRAGPDDWGPAPRNAGRFENEAATHVFLVGFPRSGTTLLEQVLAGHPDVVALEEAPTLAEPQARFLTSPMGCMQLSRLAANEADAWRARYWAAVAAHGASARGKVFVDKAPAGTHRLPLVAKLFPGAKVLFALRDPRDVVLSCLRHNFQINAMTYAFTDLAEAADCYGACMALAEVYRGVLALDQLDVRHESLVEDFETELTRITRFIGLGPHADMSDVAAIARRRSVRTPSAPQVRAGLNRAGMGRWRAYAEQLAPVREALAPWVERFGYEA